MMKKIHKTLALVAVIVVFSSGCRSTEEYKKFAEAGTQFAEANNLLLDIAGKVKINLTSEQVLSDRTISKIAELNLTNSVEKKIIDDYIQRYNNYSRDDQERLELLNELRTHNQLLQAYFLKLIELANSDASARTQVSVESIANQLQASGSKVIQLNSDKIDKLPLVTRIVLDASIRGFLRQELEKRKEAIYKEITIQEKVFDILAESIKKDLKNMRELQEYRLVIMPLIQQQEIDEDEWIKTREEILTKHIETISLIKTASNNFKEFKEIFQASIEGEVTSERINKLLKNSNYFHQAVSKQE
jgi:hypothetical protein